MKQTIFEHDFIRAFSHAGREGQFSKDALKALFQHLVEIEDSAEVEFELDVVALCCDFSEIDVSDVQSETGCDDIDDLREKTSVIEVDDDTIIYQAF